MESNEKIVLANKLWRVLEMLQRVNILVDLDEEDFNDNNIKCKQIREITQRLNDGIFGALDEELELAAKYAGIFSEEKH